MGWKSLGVLELTALPSIKPALWIPMLQETDALLVGGGDCQYLCYWLQQSGLAGPLPSLLSKTVYVGLSAGSMVTTNWATTYGHHNLPAESDQSLGLLDFALHPIWITGGSRKIPWPTGKAGSHATYAVLSY